MRIANRPRAASARQRRDCAVALLAALSLAPAGARSQAPVPQAPPAVSTAPPPSPSPAGSDPGGVQPAEGAARATARHRRGKPKMLGVLNVNRASEAELRLLPGIGKTRAAQIVARRQQHPYASLDDLARLRGMRKLVQRLHAHLAVKGDSTLRPAAP